MDNYYYRGPEIAVPGTSLNVLIEITTLPSVLHKDKLIKYYTYSWDPGMIYWNYVNKPVKNNEMVWVLEKREEKRKERVAQKINEVDELIGGTITALLLYEALQWGIAALFAPVTGGASFGAALCF